MGVAAGTAFASDEGEELPATGGSTDGFGEGVRLGFRNADRSGILPGVGRGFDWLVDEDAGKGRDGAETDADSRREFR